VSRAFASASIPVTKEQVGLLRSDGKHPDGLTLVPLQSGKPLTWDEVCQICRPPFISPFSAYRPGDFGFNELLHSLILFRLRSLWSCLV